jgi:kynureninase
MVASRIELESVLNRAECVELDRRDPLTAVREQFLLPDGVIFMGGNSLGALPAAAHEAVERLVRDEWGNGLLRSWNAAGWIDAPRRVGDKIGQLLGARPGEIVVADSTSVNLFKVLAAALRHQSPERRVILTEDANFPTDLFVAQGVAAMLAPEAELRTVPRDGVREHLEGDVAVVMLTHVDYVSAAVLDMTEVTRAVRETGALMLWDLSHSAGAVPVDLNASAVDLAVGCGYKYLNGGPGAPAYLFVAEHLQADLLSPIWGWMGDASPFAFSPTYDPAAGADRFLAGTPAMVSMAALEAAIDVWLLVDQASVWRASRTLSELLIQLIDERCGQYGVTIASPREPRRRGSHVALRHPDAYSLKLAIGDRGVIGDFRPPDVIRLAVTPLYLGHADIWDAVDRLVDVLVGRAHEDEGYRVREKVT